MRAENWSAVEEGCGAQRENRVFEIKNDVQFSAPFFKYRQSLIFPLEKLGHFDTHLVPEYSLCDPGKLAM